jgi:hypothetical protein
MSAARIAQGLRGRKAGGGWTARRPTGMPKPSAVTLLTGRCGYLTAANLPETIIEQALVCNSCGFRRAFYAWGAPHKPEIHRSMRSATSQWCDPPCANTGETA